MLHGIKILQASKRCSAKEKQFSHVPHKSSKKDKENMWIQNGVGGSGGCWHPESLSHTHINHTSITKKTTTDQCTLYASFNLQFVGDIHNTVSDWMQSLITVSV